MLAFIDEAGDSGLKVSQGSSTYFSVAMILFEEHADAERCDQRIQLLKSELSQGPDYEFHFSKNSWNVRRKFLTAVAPYNFLYFIFSLNKASSRLYGPGFQHKESLYKYTCGLVFENAKPYLNNAIIVIDKSGSETFRSRLGSYLKRKVGTKEGKCLIKKVKMQDSKANNLLQLADYVAGVMNRKIQEKGDWEELYRFIAVKEMQARIWPPA